MAHQIRSRCTNPGGTDSAKSKRLSAAVHPSRGVHRGKVASDTWAALAAELDRRMDRLRERGYQMETEWDEEAAAESDSNTAQLAALPALRKAAIGALCIGMSPEHATRLVKEIMALGVQYGWGIGSESAHFETHMRNLAGTTRGADVGAGRLSRHERRNGE